ncbi:hypothetical protein ACEPPN_006086 [Leptodophora sp. 'Broadleaf-Isolate-01']
MVVLGIISMVLDGSKVLELASVDDNSESHRVLEPSPNVTEIDDDGDEMRALELRKVGYSSEDTADVEGGTAVELKGNDDTSEDVKLDTVLLRPTEVCADEV